jgi:hypothetical protein
MYGVDVRHITKLADWCPGLLKVVKQKLRGDDADRAKNMIFRFPTVMGSDRSWKMMSRVQLSGVNKTLLVNYKMGLTNYTTLELQQFWECTTRICRLLMLSGVTC